MKFGPLYEQLVYIPIGWREKLIERVVFEDPSHPDPKLLNGEVFQNDTIYRFTHGRLNSTMFKFEDEDDYSLMPAIETADGHLEYYAYGILHRDDGPAVIAAFGAIEQYWKDGEFIKEVINDIPS